MLLEIRIGPGKQKIASWVSNFCDKCEIPDNKIHRVPHISLYGSFTGNLSQIEKVTAVVAGLGRNYSFLPYTIDGIKHIRADKGIVVYFNIVPSDELKNFRDELVRNIKSIVPDTKPFDFDRNFLFHSTLAYKLSESEFERISSYENSVDSSENSIAPHFYLPMAGLRITLLGNQAHIVWEYDLLQQKFLSRSESLSKHEWQRTSKLFRIKKRMEKYHESSDSIYLIGDLHLNHSNIIRYCARPFLFSDVNEMNNILVENWNNVVDNKNVVYFLGDLDSKDSVGSWIKHLNGKKIFIEGNHDVVKNREGIIIRHKIYGAVHSDIISQKGYKFYLIHDPKEVPDEWRENNPDGWVIHGHKHDNDVNKYPFINGDKKTINVSAELTNYRPVSLDYILSLDLNSIERMDMIDSVPKRKISPMREIRTHCDYFEECPYGNVICPFPFLKEKIQREKGYLYFVGKDGYLWATPMKHNKTGKKKKVSTEQVTKCKYSGLSRFHADSFKAPIRVKNAPTAVATNSAKSAITGSEQENIGWVSINLLKIVNFWIRVTRKKSK